jgi:hypothetical protein
MVENSLDTELRAMQEIATILHRLDQPTRARVLRWIVERFQSDAAFVATGAPVMPPSAVTAPRGVQPASNSHDDTLSTDRLDEFFEDAEPEAAIARTRGATSDGVSAGVSRQASGSR